MKKMREGIKRNQIRRSALEMRLRGRAKRYARRVGRRRKAVIFDRTTQTLVAPSHFVIFSPSSINLGREIDDYFEFLRQLRELKVRKVCIDMTNVRMMVADAALLFKAELSRLVEDENLVITAKSPVRDKIKQVLKQTGISKLLNLFIEVSPNHNDVVHWRVAEGSRSLIDPEALASIMDDIEAVTGMASHPLYQGIIESMANCVEHAYKPHSEVSRPMPSGTGWWVFQQVKDNVLSVVVCDLGIGVRRSLPLTLAKEVGLYKKLMHLTRRTKGIDNRALLAAMEYGRTSTKETQRGKGMRNAHRVVDELGEGDFVALSNAGAYAYRRKGDGSDPLQTTVRLRHSIHGTILGWKLPLKSSFQADC